MVEHQILMSGAMVRATMRAEDPKVQTRRPAKRIPWRPGANQEFSHARAFENAGEFRIAGHDELTTGFRCPYGRAGDRLWVRETWADVNYEGAPGIAYRANGDVRDLMEDASFLYDDGAFNYRDPRVANLDFAAWSSDLVSGVEGRWRPSIHMPRWACRLVLEITEVRLERLQRIGEADAIAEGIDGPMCAALSSKSPWTNVVAPAAVHAFAALWEQTYGPGAWAANPWVWALTFRRVS